MKTTKQSQTKIQKVPYEIIDFVIKNCDVSHKYDYSDDPDHVISWNGTSNDVATIRRMIREAYDIK